jgi:hypothetical protein
MSGCEDFEPFVSHISRLYQRLDPELHTRLMEEYKDRDLWGMALSETPFEGFEERVCDPF